MAKAKIKREKGGVFKRLGNKEKSVSSRSDSHNQRSYSRYMEAFSESDNNGGGHWKSRSKEKKPSREEDDLSQPWVCEEIDPFTPRIRYFNFPKIRMPSHIKTYDGRNARVWFDDLPAESIDSYDDLKKAFLENYLQQKKYIKDPIELHNIKQRDGESTKDFEVFDIDDEFCNGGELLGMVRVGCMTYFQDYKWYDELTDGKLKEEALTHKARIEESWGKATPRVMKFCEWLKNSFENFKELDYDVLVKLEECWWKVNAHEKAPFARCKNYGQGPYANAKTKKDYDPYLDNNCIFEKNYKANNAGDTQDTKKEFHDPSICTIRRFEMVKYSFKDDEEYVAIKENEYEDLTSTSEDA
ncbi:reverse transcriptase domain-containing protein, partial [Tanacetum coccineum]